jgi:hypothetical protein
MRPTNQKALYSVICKGIEDVDATDAQYLDEKIAKLDSLVRATRLATDMIAEEMKRAKLEIEINNYKGTKNDVFIREIESKGFDDTTHVKDDFDY